MILFILLLALVGLTSGASEHQQTSPSQLRQERRFVFNRIFVANQLTLKPEDTHYLLTKLREIHNRSAALGITLLLNQDDQVESSMIDFLLTAANISRQNCDRPEIIEDRWLFGRQMEKYSNIPSYIEHYNQKQLDFCGGR